MDIKYSLIIPVYNRPEEVNELLESIEKQTYQGYFEVLIIEDGSLKKSDKVVEKYLKSINLRYFYKENSGPGDSRNFGMERSFGNYFIILDSDCILPEFYLENVNDYLQRSYVDCFGGKDAANESFTDVQKSINYAMTSFLTTGGIRGSEKSITKFEPRSFNMGISKNVFEKVGGFGKIHPGEDPDFVIRVWESGFKTGFIEDAFVYHKRRIDWNSFKKQVSKFGQTRVILNYWHKKYKRFIHCMPSLFILGLVLSFLGLFFYRIEGLMLYICYFLFIFMDSSRQNRSLKIGFMSCWAVFLQFLSYGLSFIIANIKMYVKKGSIEEKFPHLFFK